MYPECWYIMSFFLIVPAILSGIMIFKKLNDLLNKAEMYEPIRFVLKSAIFVFVAFEVFMYFVMLYNGSLFVI